MHIQSKNFIHIARQVNSSRQSVYWNLGKLLLERQLEEGYGSGVVKRLSIDLKNEFPDMGLSPRNLWDMKRFYERYYQADTKLLQAVAVLPWGHNLLLLDKLQSLQAAEFYASEAVSKGWSRDLIPTRIQWKGIFCGYAFLPPRPAFTRGDRIENWQFQSGIRWENEFVSFPARPSGKKRK
jgi:predicted nuclease of restriction endonuclease-like (RecB) superfamily